MPQTGYVTMSSSGCLLPMLIMFNLFFGKFIFGSTGLWLAVEGMLVLIFILKIKLMASRISRHFEQQAQGGFSDRVHSQIRRPAGKVIDVQGQEVNDDKDSK
jgi:hypothetical protein